MTFPESDKQYIKDIEPLRVAVIGSGPAGIYAAEALTRQQQVPVHVDIMDRLPTPYGLVRYGVAPDHLKIKGVVRALRQVLEHPDVHFLGGVEFGTDLSRADLARTHHAVVYATGAAVDRRMGIPGEDLPGSFAATDFVNWYCAHPDSALDQFVLDSEEVAVVGAGNVAIDVARILLKGADELSHTDIPQPVLDVLASGRVRTVHLLARRGPRQAKFTSPELRELLSLPGVDVDVRAEQVDLDPATVDAGEPGAGQLSRAVRTNLKLLREHVDRPAGEGPRTLRLHFWTRPLQVQGDENGVSGLRVERTRLASDGSLVGTGQTAELDVGMVLRSVGYASVPLPEVAFDDRSRTVPQEEGRVLDAKGDVVRGDYVVGWIKRGPSGVIGTNKSDAAATIRSLLEDAPALREAVGELLPLEKVLDEHGPVVRSNYRDWLRIDAEEARQAEELGRGERVKLHGWQAYRRVLDGH